LIDSTTKALKNAKTGVHPTIYNFLSVNARFPGFYWNSPSSSKLTFFLTGKTAIQIFKLVWE